MEQAGVCAFLKQCFGMENGSQRLPDNSAFHNRQEIVHRGSNMAAKQLEYTTLQEEQADYPQQQQDSYPLQTRENQRQQAAYQLPQAGYQPPEASYPPQQGSYQPQQASNPPPQARYPPPQARYPPPQAGFPPQQGYPQPPPQRQATATDIIDQQPSLAKRPVVAKFGKSPVRTVCPHCRVTVVSTTHEPYHCSVKSQAEALLRIVESRLAADKETSIKDPTSRLNYNRTQADCPQQQQDGYPVQTQPRLVGYSPEQASYPPEQASYSPQQASYPPQQASYPPQ
ncbi:hypothetical protein ACROYT_G030086 [Oculina patagonica]